MDRLASPRLACSVLRVMPRFAVTVHTPEMLVNFEYVLAGLFELEHEKKITLRMKLDLGLPEWGINTTRCIVRDIASGCSKVVMFDSRDQAGAFLPKYWEGVDCYFKRSFERAALEREVPAEHWQKFHPMGLYFPVRSRHEHGMARFYAAAYAYTWLNTRSRGSWRFARDLVARVRARTHTIRERKNILCVDRFLTSPVAPTSEPIVLYQTRVFAPIPDEHPEFLASKLSVNEQRAALVRRLRSELGEQFVGGLVADDHARSLLPDLSTDQAMLRSKYIVLMQRARVVVYTQGLVGSAAWKLSEYLAAGRAIVMQRLSCELPEPLVDGRDVLVFDTPDECVVACKALLADPERAAALGAAAQRYYREWVDPARNVWRMLELTAGESAA